MWFTSMTFGLPESVFKKKTFFFTGHCAFVTSDSKATK